LEIGSRRAVRPIAVISESQLNADSLRQPWVMARLGFLRGGKLVGDFTLSFQRQLGATQHERLSIPEIKAGSPRGDPQHNLRVQHPQ
jgi:hypothetical protein